MSFQRKFVQRQIKEGNLIRAYGGRLVSSPVQKKPTPWVWRTHGAEVAAKKLGKSPTVARAKALAA